MRHLGDGAASNLGTLPGDCVFDGLELFEQFLASGAGFLCGGGGAGLIHGRRLDRALLAGHRGAALDFLRGSDKTGGSSLMLEL